MKERLYHQEYSLGKGILGAIGGALIGAIIWILIYQLGYISAIGAAALLWLTFSGFKYLGKRMTIAGFVICLLISIGTLPLAIYVAYVVEAMREIGSSSPSDFMEIFANLLPYIMSDVTIKSAVLEDVVFSYLFLAAASIYEVIDFAKEAFHNKRLAKETEDNNQIYE